MGGAARNRLGKFFLSDLQRVGDRRGTAKADRPTAPS